MRRYTNFKQAICVWLSILSLCGMTSQKAYALDPEDVIKAIIGKAVQDAAKKKQEQQRQRQNSQATTRNSNPSVATRTSARKVSQDLLRTQVRLKELGYDVGQPDGRDGPRTQAGVAAFQAPHSLNVTGTISFNGQAVLHSNAVRQALRAQSSGATGPFLYRLGFDLSGSDYRSSWDDQRLANASLDQCNAACISDAQCRAFTYNTAANVCFLKSGVPKPAAFKDAISGIKQTTRLAEQNNTQTRSLDDPTPAPPLIDKSDTQTVAQTPNTLQGNQFSDVVVPDFGVTIADNGNGSEHIVPVQSKGGTGLPLQGLAPLGGGGVSVDGTWRGSVNCYLPMSVELEYYPDSDPERRGILQLGFSTPEGISFAAKYFARIDYNPMTSKVNIERGSPIEYTNQENLGTIAQIAKTNLGGIYNNMRSIEGSLTADGAAMNLNIPVCEASGGQGVVSKVSEEQLAKEKAEREALAAQFASHPMIGTWKGYGICNAVPVGLGLQTSAVPQGISAQVKVFPLIQNPTLRYMSYEGQLGNSSELAGAFMVVPSGKNAVYGDRRIRFESQLEPFRATLQLDKTSRVLSGQLQLDGCAALTMAPIGQDDFQYLDFAFNPDAPLFEASKIKPVEQVFSASSLNNACRASFAWHSQIVADKAELTDKRSAQLAFQRARALTAALFLDQNFVPFFGKSASDITYDEGTALYDVINSCSHAGYPDAGLITGYFPNARVTVKGIREQIDASMQKVRPASDWYQSASQNLASLKGDHTEGPILASVSSGLKKHRDFLLPQHAALIEKGLQAAENKLAEAKKAEAERLRQAKISNLLAKLDTEDILTLDDLVFLKKEAFRPSDAQATEARISLVNEQLNRLLRASFPRLYSDQASQIPASELRELSASIRERFSAFQQTPPVLEAGRLVTDLSRAKTNEFAQRVDGAIAAITDKPTLLRAAMLTEQLSEFPTLKSKVPSKRQEVKAKAEAWVSSYLEQYEQQPQEAADRGSVEAQVVPTDNTANVTIEEPEEDLLGGFAALLGEEEQPTQSLGASSGLPDVFSNGTLKQQDLLRALHEGDFTAVYQLPRADTRYYLVKLTNYFQQACPAAVPSGMVTHLIRSRVPAGAFSNNRDEAATAGLQMLAEGLMALQNPGQLQRQIARQAELEAQVNGDAFVLGQAFGCPGEGLKSIMNNAFSYMKDPTKGVSNDAVSLYDICMKRDNAVMVSQSQYCNCAMNLLQTRVSPDFVSYVKIKPEAHLTDVWRIFPYIAREQQRCHQ